MTSYKSEGKRINWTNSTGSDVASGGVAVGTDAIAIAVVDIDNGDSGAVATEGEYSLPAASAETWTFLQQLYWDAASGELTNVASGNTPAGKAGATKAAGVATGRLLLNR